MGTQISCGTCLDRYTDPWDRPCVHCHARSGWQPACTPATPAVPTSPAHYARWKIQPLDFIAANNIDFLRGNIIKYILRYDAKNGLEDLEKARVYLEKLVAKVEKEKTD
ncbi:MAG: DUF3310 domain-containing protein [Desulfovibrio sp.]|uniref:DUF3310 domain-containing protein n=1 Tax=Desulfovibrio sp. TaxID=885 RepID=UPI00258A6C33|nr:DUF3310 domain-containing protein [Desulfovibrio sp.]MCD7983742.1 DUF3310 domain-containing protein [Desulfovibrio sp.]